MWGKSVETAFAAGPKLTWVKGVFIRNVDVPATERFGIGVAAVGGGKLLCYPLALLLSLIVALTACAPSLSRVPLPQSALADASALAPAAAGTGLGLATIRMWGDEKPAWFQDFITTPDADVQAAFPAVYGKPQTYLAISGGGSNGAYGAGLLAGWTASGKRPQFTMVTGISTGSLIAPFAFLGADYDRQLTEIYTQYSTKDLVKRRSLMGVISQASAADVAPLKNIIAKYVDSNLMAQIAAEHRKGRRLFVGTTNLDAERPVIWNIGAIANSSDPAALQLIREVLLASASIPGAFPPVLIKVNSDGKAYDELHVDGGTTNQVFVYPIGIDWKAVLTKLHSPAKPELYVIRNASLDPTYDPVQPKLVPIAGRSISTLIRTQGVGDTYRIYLAASRDGLRYHLAYIPRTFDAESKEAFDTVYMRKLFDFGYEQGKSGSGWASAPPELQ
jgi:predicted patatin/cPLA2 family phospholipase